MIAGKVSRPYRAGVVDADRGIIKFAASNPGFTALLAEQAKTYDRTGSTQFT
jgi:hypothetical protein